MLSYEEVFSRARGRIDDPKELMLDLDDLIEIYTERLHKVCGDPRVRKKFETLSLKDEIQSIIFQLKYPVDEDADRDFVVNLLSLGMAIEWYQPKVDTAVHLSTMIGGKEEKKVLDNYKQIVERLDSLKTEQKKLIRDYGYLHNGYISEGS